MNYACKRFYSFAPLHVETLYQVRLISYDMSEASGTKWNVRGACRRQAIARTLRLLHFAIAAFVMTSI